MIGLDHTPLDIARLSPPVQKALAAGPTRMMAARGLVPLQRPGDLLTVLYQLAIDGDAAIAGAARATAAGLPEKVLAGALVDAGLDPRVLDWIAPGLAHKPALQEAVIANPATADQTMAIIAAKGGAHEVDLVAQNEQRLLRHPEIIAAMYTNPKARMSTVDRAVELAVRNQVRVPGLAAWDEIARALAGGAPVEDDAAFSQAAAGLAELDDSPLISGDAEAFDVEESSEGEAAPEVDEKRIPINKLSIPGKIRLATLGNAFARGVLVRDPLKIVAVAAIKSPGVSEIEAARYAGNQALCEDVIRFIAGKREWTKLYGVKKSLIMNPKSPLPDVTRLLPHMRDKDLRNIAKSKGVPSAVVAQTRRLLSQRAPGAKK
jgi:hypothetical protein